MRRFTLQTFLFLCLGALAAVPALVLGIAQTERWGAEQIDQSEREIQLATELLSGQVSQLMALHVREAESLARQVEARGSLEPDKLQTIVTVQHLASPGMSGMYVANPAGVGLVFDPPINSLGLPKAGTDFSDRDYYQELVRTGQTTVSKVEFGKNTHRPVVPIAAPIWNPDNPGQLMGYAEGTVDLDQIQLIVERLGERHPSLKMVVLDPHGGVLAHPDQSLRASVADLSGVPLFASGGNLANRIRVADDETGTAYRGLVRRIDEQGLGWQVMVGRPEATVQTSMRAGQQQVLSVVIGALALSLALAGLLAALIARPVVGVTIAADAVARGDFSRVLPRSRWWHSREVHTQILAVKRMIERLRARTEELEHQVAARTADLVATNRELAEAQQRYHSLFAQNPDGVFAMDLEGRILSVNPAGESLCGYTADVLVGHTFGGATDSNRRTEQGTRRLERVMRGEAMQWEASIQHRDGHHIEIHVTMMPTLVDGRIVGVFGIVKDITERKHTERAVARSEERYRSLVQNGAELISVVDGDGVLRHASPSVETLLGVDAESAIGQNLLRFLHPEDEPVLRRLLETAKRSPSQNLTEAFRLRNADGEWRHVEVVCRNLATVAEIGGIVLNVRDVTERKALEAELAYRAYHDALTGLPNRALLIDRLGHALAGTARSQLSTGVLFIDLDDFKLVNDSLGHKQGDQLLVSVAQRLLAAIRPGDSVARLGGDEFIVLFEDLADVSDASSVAERILQQLGTAFELDGHEVFISATMGMAVSGVNTVLPDDLLRDADVAMYAAKARGKGHWALYQAGMDTRPLERLELEADLRRAVVGGELRLHYQPIVEIVTGQIRGVEALLRWEHPQRGLMPPMEFIPIAEEAGLIVPIGRWVLHEACRQARAWDERNPARPALTISVNISSRQFQHPGLVEDVRQALGAARLSPSRLRLEITESVAMERGQATVQTLQALKTLGVRLAIDDFGTGYSSLAYLKHFPVDVLKIDRAFVDGLGHDAQDAAIVRSVITIAKSLDLTVTGEGVETAEQLSVLRGLECDEAQGYYFARPMLPAAMDRLLDAQLAASEDLPQAA